MITTKQKWLLGGLLAMSAGVWTPQILGGGGGGDSSAQVARDGPTEAEMLEMEAEMGSWDNGGAAATGGAVGAGASGGTTTEAHDMAVDRMVQAAPSRSPGSR